MFLSRLFKRKSLLEKNLEMYKDCVPKEDLESMKLYLMQTSAKGDYSSRVDGLTKDVYRIHPLQMAPIILN